MKKLVRIFLIVFETFYVSNLFSQNAGITSLGSIIACPGTSTITIPLYITNSPPITAISLKIVYDSSVLSFCQNGIVNINPGLSTYFASNQSPAGTGFKQLRISWYSSTTSIIDTNGTGKLADILFRYLGGTTTVSFDNSTSLGSLCEYADSGGNALIDTPSTSFYQDGMVTQGNIPSTPGIISGNLSPCINAYETYSVVNSPCVTYTWTAPSTWIGTSTTDSITYFIGNFNNGTVLVTPSNSCGTGSSDSIIVTQTNIPSNPGIISGNLSPCTGVYETYSVANSPGVTYSWTAPSTWIGTSTTDSITYFVGNFITGTIMITPSNLCGTGSSDSIIVNNCNSGIINDVGNFQFLADNFPNPFKDNTEIAFEISEQGFITIDVFNIFGEYLFNVINDFFSQGKHEICLDGSKLPEGIYPLRIRYNLKGKIFSKVFLMNIVK